MDIMENTQDFQIFTENHTMNLVQNGANLLVANYLVHFSLFDYKRNYKSSFVPFEFIRYYINKVGSYSSYFVEQLTYFYKHASIQELDIEFLIHTYQSSLTALPVEIKTQKGIKGVQITQEMVDLLGFLAEYAYDDEPAKTIYNNIAQIAKLITESDEILPPSELWKRYMIDKFLDEYTPTNINVKPEEKKTAKEDNKPSIEKVTKEAEEAAKSSVSKDFDQKLKGKETQMPKQQGKVQKLIIPKLLLPSSYPVLTKSSRINSDYRATSFSPADKMLHLFAGHGFKAVHYSTGFLEKRSVVKKTKPKFSFEF